jgi:FKBP-type peptidyl-prolyl cis-trans isomerase
MTTLSKKFLPLALSFVLTACGGAAAPPTIETTTFAPSLNVSLAASTKMANGEYYRTTNAGGGAAIVAGQTLQVHYTGWLTDGTKFDTNVGLSAFSFQLGTHYVIQGWDEGFVGAHVGDTRQLIIPPELAYGPYGQGSIPPNAILVFSVLIDSAK